MLGGRCTWRPDPSRRCDRLARLTPAIERRRQRDPHNYSYRGQHPPLRRPLLQSLHPRARYRAGRQGSRLDRCRPDPGQGSSPRCPPTRGRPRVAGRRGRRPAPPGECALQSFYSLRGLQQRGALHAPPQWRSLRRVVLSSRCTSCSHSQPR